MIQSRRQAHFYMVTVLCVVTPIMAIAAMIWRPSVPLVKKDELFTLANFADPDQTQVHQTLTPLSIEGSDILTKIVTQGQQTYLEITPQTTLAFADILVYGLPQDAKTDAVSEQAILLGKLSGTHPRQFTLPSGFLETSKQLLFYSQAQSKVIGAASLQLQESES